MKYTIQLGLVALLAASAACSSNNNPMSPSATPGAGNVAAVPEGTPTLKANTPGSPSPGLRRDDRARSAEHPPGDAVGVQRRGDARQHGGVVAPLPAVRGQHPAGRAARAGGRRRPYELDGHDAAEVRHDVHVACARGTHRWLRGVVVQLDVQDARGPGVRRQPHTRSAAPARACRSPTARVWSMRRSPRAPTWCVVRARSSGGTWEFMDYLVDELRKEDNRWGYNGKRGNVNDPSQDIVDYHWGAGPSDNSTAVYIIDIMLGHCGSPVACLDRPDSGDRQLGHHRPLDRSRSLQQLMLVMTGIPRLQDPRAACPSRGRRPELFGASIKGEARTKKSPGNTRDEGERRADFPRTSSLALVPWSVAAQWCSRIQARIRPLVAYRVMLRVRYSGGNICGF